MTSDYSKPIHTVRLEHLFTSWVTQRADWTKIYAPLFSFAIKQLCGSAHPWDSVSKLCRCSPLFASSAFSAGWLERAALSVFSFFWKLSTILSKLAFTLLISELLSLSFLFWNLSSDTCLSCVVTSTKRCRFYNKTLLHTAYTCLPLLDSFSLYF